MHAAVFTIILTAGIHYNQTAVDYSQCGGDYVGQAEGYGGVYPYDARVGHGALWVQFGPMPQSCYQPRYGCYPGATRHTHRHSAFHGWFYRRPYNYRNLFEYPWHAELHEPTSFFSHDVNRKATTDALETHSVPAPEEEIAPPSASTDGVPISNRAMTQRDFRSEIPRVVDRPEMTQRRSDSQVNRPRQRQSYRQPKQPRR